MHASALTTGLSGLDGILKGLLPGDNLVWEVDSVEDYRSFVEPFAAAGHAAGASVNYYRFARHEPLLTSSTHADIHELNTADGFEPFIQRIHRIVHQTRNNGVHIFDCLSDLAEDWCSDHMLANFFRLICPYVYEVSGLAYFAVQRGLHAPDALATIADTTQILLAVYQHKTRLYLHPTKVQQRHSPTMYMLHERDGDRFHPVTASAPIAEIMTSTPHVSALSARPRQGLWVRAFHQAEENVAAAQRGRALPQDDQSLKRRWMRMLLSREERMIDLAENYFSLEDLLQIRRRMIGTGLIGGKSLGVLLARAILYKTDPAWRDRLEAHDSFYVGSDVFYSFLVQNGCWWIRAKQSNPKTFLDDAEEGRRRILTGAFPPAVEQDFAAMLEYFGQSPIIVRSSSLLEDAFGNSFAGKYESIFCVNQGSPRRRLEDFIAAVRSVYASSMSEQALRYRAQRGLLARDEQMSLLVQRVSGTMQADLFFPHIAGVGLSYNSYAWNERIDPSAGLLRIVFGLGTRAVDRSDDDYTRVIAINAPTLRPEPSIDEVRRYTQRRVDVLDLAANQLVARDFVDVAGRCPDLQLDIFTSRDEEMERRAAEAGRPAPFSSLLTFDRLLSDTAFVADMRNMLKTLEAAYGVPVDIEYTVNFLTQDQYKINLVQCRSLQVRMDSEATTLPAEVRESDLLFEARGAVVGRSRSINIDRLIYVVPAVYGQSPLPERYRIARLIGRLIHIDGPRYDKCITIMGPGRWGTTTPALGVPVSYAEINGVSAICEIVAMRENLVPDVSLGTHFFNELVEQDVLYFALFPDREGNRLNQAFFENSPNLLTELIPTASAYTDAIKVIDSPKEPAGRILRLTACCVSQRVLCLLDNENPSAAKSP